MPTPSAQGHGSDWLEQVEYEKLRRAEDRMWWFGALHANLLMLYRRTTLGRGSGQAVLDAGCGTGGLLARLSERFPALGTVGLDADETACLWAARKSARPVCTGSVNQLPFRDGSFAVIVSADVLCHVGVDNEQALAQFHRCLAAGGILILNLPAYRWLMSGHDAAVYNARRYTRKEVLALLCAAGFRPLFASYWNTLLFPLMVAARKLMPAALVRSDVELPPRFVDAAFRAVTVIEHGLLRAGIRLPFGGSVLAVAAKPEAAHG